MRKKNLTSHIADFDKSGGYTIGDSTRIPEQATHLLMYSRNVHGENPTPVAVQIVDNMAPCQRKSAQDCPAGVRVMSMTESVFVEGTESNAAGKKVFSVQRAKSEATVESYDLYWGRGACQEKGSRIENGHITSLEVGGVVEYELPQEKEVPDGTTHILVFSKNKWGRSKFCKSQSFVEDPSSSMPDSEAGADAEKEAVGGKPEL